MCCKKSINEELVFKVKPCYIFLLQSGLDSSFLQTVDWLWPWIIPVLEALTFAHDHNRAWRSLFCHYSYVFCL